MTTRPSSCRRALAAVAVALAVVVAVAVVEVGDGRGPRVAAADEIGGRAAERLEMLAPPIEACFARDDTDWPVFHGCIDWHSAVHASFALTVIGATTERESAGALVDGQLQPAGLAAERSMMLAGSLDHEIPYGYAWLLWADVARAELAKGFELHPVAAVAVNALSEWLSSSPDHRRVTALSSRYDNGNWAAVSLLRWATTFGDDDAARVATAAIETLTSADLQRRACTQPERSGFFSPCHMMMLAIAEAGTVAPSAAMLEFAAIDPPLVGEAIDGAHAAGLNFSRSWGLAALWRLTGDDRFLAQYELLVTAHLDQPEYWRYDYAAHAHWVAQFGVLAVYLLEFG